MSLAMRYLGLELAHPVMPAANPLASTVAGVRRLEDGGAPAITLPSIFEEQIEGEADSLHSVLDYGSESYHEAQSYFPSPDCFAYRPDAYLDLVRRAREAVHVPIIASLNGVSPRGWLSYGKLLQDAGAHALELNIYWIEADPAVSSSDVEDRYVSVVQAVTSAVTIPVAVKIGPFFASPGHLLRRIAQAGARGAVLFNRFYQPDFDLDLRQVRPSLSFSTSADLRLPLHWTAMLSHSVPELDYAISGGVHSPADVLKSVLAGAQVASCAATLLMHGPAHIRQLVHGIQQWLDEQEIPDLHLIRGSMNSGSVADPSSFLRANYMKELQSFRPMPFTVRA